ncbi:MAG: Gldg family protein, partial [Dysgonamonadaceae bacterium]|nr:Gldg family protein [Dysgonamonadaceae bacterium]
MYTLLSKELRSIFNSVSGILFSCIFLIVCGCLLWFIPGNYNIAESGYASLSSFFALAPVLLLVLIPALAMRTFSEEKKQGTLSLLITRPVSLFEIVFSKYLAVFISIVVVLLPTLIYVVFLSYSALPQGNIDWGAITGSYLGLLFLVSTFVAISVFASSLTSNQVVAFITGLLICIVFYFGFDLFSGLFSSGKTHYMIRNIGFLSHYQSIQKGVIDISDIIYFFVVSCLFLVFTKQTLTVISSTARNLPSNYRRFFISILALATLLIASFFFSFKFDLTSDKRYTLSKPVKTLLREIELPVTVEFYLTGDLNSGFYQLQRASLDMLNDFSDLSSGKVSYRVINPYQEDKEFIKTLSEKGIKAIAVNERNREGKIVQQIVFPYLLFISGENEIPVSLLVNEPGKSGEENLNASIGMLEYRLTQALENVIRKEPHKITFLQGHGELTHDQMSDLFDLLSYNYEIYSGTLPENPEVNILDDSELVIIPGPQEPFAEDEKYILDQYIMRGGKVMWIINGVKLDLHALATAGATPTMANEVNLEDLLFGYGFRIEPVLLADVQCLEIPIDTNMEDVDDSFEVAPWFYAPILNATQGPIINKGISLVKTAYASILSFVGKEAENPVRNQVLLHSSELSAIVQVPEKISLHEINRI